MEVKELIARKEFEVRFSEVDSMGIVWHGAYAKYFEDGREEFGKKYGLTYMYIFKSGYYAPLVDLKFQYKQPLQYETKAIVEVKFLNLEAAKLKFEYRIYMPHDNSTVCTGESTQVFLNTNRELQWFNPPFFEEWKAKHGLI